jgi:hypothetical protein
MLLLSVLVFCAVFFAPHVKYHDPRTFFAVANSSRWLVLGEWASALCSFRILLLSLGAVLVWASIEEILISSKRINLAIWFTVLLFVPVMIFIAGLYFLFKAVL